LDIDKRKKAEMVQKRLATAIEQSADGVAIVDARGKIEYVNPAYEKITGYSADEVIGAEIGSVEENKFNHEFLLHQQDTLSPGESWGGRQVENRKDGTVYHEEVTVSPVRDSQARVSNYVIVKRDVSKEFALQEQLLHAQKMEAVGTLAGGVAHDFNNLLQVVLGFTEMLLLERSQADSEYADLQKILQAATSGAELVKQLLTFGRKVEPNLTTLDLNKHVLRVEKLISRTIPKMVDIRLNLSQDVGRICADPSQIEQILLNLALNARDAMPHGGTLVIDTSNVEIDQEFCIGHVGAQPGEYVSIGVSDTGHGMSSEVIGKIFEPFYTTKEFGRGTGLGLAMVYGIVKQHGGYIFCESSLGKGTTFKLYFPTISSIEIPAAGLIDLTQESGTESVLLVDDEALVRELGDRILTARGYTVLKAGNGKEALDIYTREKDSISLIILDLIMPKMSGKDCLQKILDINPKIKVLIASGYAMDASTKECLNLGAKGFVAKPFRVKELLQQVRGTLDN
jgi:two-component system cell cycle sensor histidine kinase/response regulator CckA